MKTGHFYPDPMLDDGGLLVSPGSIHFSLSVIMDAPLQFQVRGSKMCLAISNFCHLSSAALLQKDK